MKKGSFRTLLLLGSLPAICWPIAAQVKVWQGTITLPTYEEGQPDPNPPFDIYETNRFNYPYTLRTNLTGVKADHAWRAIFVENEYLKCTVLPDIGGHLYTCVDKISGQSMFYANPSIKKAKIGYRGAWAAFGVEYNFPVSHNWVSMSPVDFAYAAHEDGSASVWVGNIDRVYGMQWSVELVLKPGSTLLEQRVTLYNRSDLRHRYYWWSNAAVQVWDDSQIEYPMQFTASHGFTEVSRWPIDSTGKDLSVIKNQTDGNVSRFVHGSHEPFMAIWNPKIQTGVAHYAEYRELPAKKIWSWGVDAAGLEWRTALSDNKSAYVEVQAGLFRNQETYSFLDPGKTISFSEYWMPVRGTGGITRANKTGVVFFDANGSNVSINLNVNEFLPAAQVSLTQDGVNLWSETTDLTPEKTWSHSVALKQPTGKVTFELKDHLGQTLLKQTDGEYDWDPEATVKTGPQQLRRFPEPESRTEDDWLQVGMDQELNGKSVLAFVTYQTALSKFPQSESIEIAAGRLAASLQRFDEAQRLLQTAQQRDTSNSEIAYYMGIAEEGLGHFRVAETFYEVAYRQADLRGPAAIRLAELQAREGKVQDAVSFLKAAVADEPANLRAQEELEAVLRATGERSEADRIAKLGISADPMSDFIKDDTGKPDLRHLAADSYRVLRVADEYMRLGLYRKALDVLDRSYPPVPADEIEPGSVLPQENPLVLYYAAYCKERLHLNAQQDWQAASRHSASYVYPSSPTDQVVLEAALAANPKDATAHFLLGTLLFSKGLSDAGIEHWTQAKQLEPHLRVVDADMGVAFLKLKSDPRRALASFREGMLNDPDNANVYVGLDQAMSLTGASAIERAAGLSQYPAADTPASKMPTNLVYQLALTRAEAKQFDHALALFKNRFFPSEEGESTSDQVLFEIKLLQAEAEANTHNCALAEDVLADKQQEINQNGRSARDEVILAEIARNCGHAKESVEFLQKAAVRADSADVMWAIKAEQSLGRYDTSTADQQIKKALADEENQLATTGHPGTSLYNIGLMESALNRKEEAKQSFERSLLLPDTHMSHHLAREALAQIAAHNE
jgi:lipopolysaccharide biosynthesis regulator YciM